jgi:hypothetical protein
MSDYDSDYEEDDFEDESEEIDDEDYEEEIESDELDEDSEDILLSTNDTPNDYTNWIRDNTDKPDITNLDINEIKGCGKFTPEERAAEYRRRGKSPSGVIDGVYNDEYRGNGEYNDEYRDWDANA